jgi:hypothetical protein
VNKVVETRASRETAPPPSDGLAKDQQAAQKGDGMAKDGAEPTAKRDPVEEVQDQAHPFT